MNKFKKYLQQKAIIYITPVLGRFPIADRLVVERVRQGRLGLWMGRKKRIVESSLLVG